MTSMGMFDDVVVNAKAAANAFSKKAGNIYDVSKLKINASSLKGEISKKCQELGEMVYSSKFEKEISQDLIDAKLNEIKALKSDLTAINELLAAAKNLTVCPACSAVIAKDSAFCSKCGVKIEHTGEAEAEPAPSAEAPGETQPEQPEPEREDPTDQQV